MPSMEWETPQDFFDTLNAEFHFTLDVCATTQTAKCKHFYSPEDDSLSQCWYGTCYMNPPYEKNHRLFPLISFKRAQKLIAILSKLSLDRSYPEVSNFGFFESLNENKSSFSLSTLNNQKRQNHIDNFFNFMPRNNPSPTNTLIELSRIMFINFSGLENIHKKFHRGLMTHVHSKFNTINWRAIIPTWSSSFSLMDVYTSFAIYKASGPYNFLFHKTIIPYIEGFMQEQNEKRIPGIEKWIERAYAYAQDGATVVCLIQGRSSDTRWWHDYVMRASEIRFIKGRLQFKLNGKLGQGSNISSAVVVFLPFCTGPPTTKSINTQGVEII